MNPIDILIKAIKQLTGYKLDKSGTTISSPKKKTEETLQFKITTCEHISNRTFKFTTKTYKINLKDIKIIKTTNTEETI